MENKKNQISNLVSNINRVRNVNNNTPITNMQTEYSILQSLSSAQSHSLRAQNQLEHLQNQLAAQKAANHAINNSLNNLQKVEHNLIEEKQFKLDILGILRGVMQNDTGAEVRIDKLKKNVVISEKMSEEDIARSNLLKEACLRGSIENFNLVINKLDKVEDLNLQDQDGKTILIHAAEKAFFYGVEKLLLKGVDVNIVDNKGANALIYSINMINIKYTKMIASKTANLNVKAAGLEGRAALHMLFDDNI